MSELALLEEISKIFIDDFSNNSMLVSEKCHICQKETIIEVVKTSGGFGINGGIFQAINQDVLNIVCIDCYKKSNRRITMKSSTQDKAEGKMHQVKGKIKEIAGKVGLNSGLEAEGKDENFEGKVQEKIGEIKKGVGK